MTVWKEQPKREASKDCKIVERQEFALFYYFHNFIIFFKNSMEKLAKKMQVKSGLIIGNF